MPRIRHLTAAIVLGLAANAAQAQTFSGVISFGDSLSDAGNYTPNPLPPPGFPYPQSFTTNPDDVWAQILAEAYGVPQNPLAVGGTNYAWGGAPTGSIPPAGTIVGPGVPSGPGDTVPGVPFPLQCVPASLPCMSVGEQVYLHLNTVGVDENALYTYWAGANDIFNYFGAVGGGLISIGTAQGFTTASASSAVSQIAALQDAGARWIVVLNLPNIGATPFGTSIGAQGAAGLSLLSLTYNQALNNGLATLQDGIIPVNAYGLVNEVLANPTLYGFTNTTQTACDPSLMGPPVPPGGSSLFCTPDDLREPGANETYFFADGVHPTGGAHRMLAQAVQAEIAAPGQVSMLGEMALNAANDHDDSLHDQMLFGNDGDRDVDSVRGFADLRISNVDFDRQAWSPASDLRQFTLTAGADHRIKTNWRWGGALSFTSQDIEVGPSETDGTAVNGSLFVAYDFAHGYIAATASGGNDSFDIERHIALGTADRVETGTTDAQRVAFSLGGAWQWGDDGFRHGPFADVTWQQIDVDGFEEDIGDATSMTFDSYERDSLISRIGYQAHSAAGKIRPYGRVAYNNESEDDQTFVRAGLVSMNGHFVMPGYQPMDNWWTAELGVSFQVNDTLSAHVAYAGLFGDDFQDRNTLNIGVRKDFGAAQEIVEPEPVVEAAPDCSSMDDDGDGVNNCNDGCPGTEAGVAVGADGCPVPVTPVEEPKPFRNP